MNISKSRILISGAGSGFGRAMALNFIGKGAKIIALDINEFTLEALKKSDNRINVYKCDVSSVEQVENIINTVNNEFGGIDVVVNNAGIMRNAPLINLLNRTDHKHSIELWNDIISINQSSVFYMTRACVDMMIMRRCKGIIINFTSISAKGNIGQTAYSASKAAVEAMTKVWSKELGRFGIRSVAIAPGFIDTTGTNEAIEEKMLIQWIEKTPLHRTGTIDEIVKTVEFVIENDFINGEIINVNGGLTM